MSMPKGYKKETGYGTTKSLGGLSYHAIANEMNERNYKMNHSTARNLFVNALMKIAENICNVYDQKFNQEKIKKIAIDPRFQESVAEYMREIEYEAESRDTNK
jgi:hypothetical protein